MECWHVEVALEDYRAAILRFPKKLQDKHPDLKIIDEEGPVLKQSIVSFRKLVEDLGLSPVSISVEFKNSDN